jgi:hypothetical protein
VREWILEFWEQLQDGKFKVLAEIRKRDVIFVRYTCTAKEYNIPDGVATFIVKNGFFSVLTNHYTLTPRGRAKKSAKANRRPMRRLATTK